MPALRQLCIGLLLLGMLACGDAKEMTRLAPLTAPEMTGATAVLRAEGMLSDSVTMLLLVLHEPSKEELAAVPTPPRRAHARLFDLRSELATDVIIDLDRGRTASVTPRAGAVPPFTRADGRTARDLLAVDAAWGRALGRRGLLVADVIPVQMGPGIIDPRWAVAGHRYLRVTAARRSSGSPFGAPVEGVAAVVDLSDKRVVEVLDVEADPPPIDTATTADAPGSRSASRGGNAGPQSYRIDGHAVSWGGWRFQFAMHPREGLVLYQVKFAPGDEQPRSILARASIAEMLVPYGDASPAWTFRQVFDVGEFGLGTTAASLIAGADLPEGATRLDAVLADDRGEPRTRHDVIGIYERDGGLRWRHGARAARSRELVIRFATTVGNYDYAFSWIMSPDGHIAMEVDLTGMMQVKGVHSADPRFGVQVAPHLAAIHHQHFFSFRLDFDVAGTLNRVREVEVAPLAVDSLNPHGTAFAWQSSVLGSERLARRDAAASRSRHWVVEHAHERDVLGGSPGYTLVPGTFPELLAAPDSPIRARGAFAAHPLWVTAFAADERYPAGEFPGQDPGGSGLPRFQSDDAVLDGTDLVVWYTAGMTHVPRPEEWPIMPVSRLRFELRPTHFTTPLRRR